MRRTKPLYSVFIMLWPLLAALIATGFLLLLCGEPVVEIARVLIVGSWGTPRDLCVVFVKTTPLVFTGLAVLIPYRAGLFNIGGEGQFFVGSLAAACTGAFLSVQWGVFGFLHLIVALLAGIAGGAAWVAIPALLKTQRGVHEVLTTIIFNFLAFYTVNYLIQGPFTAGVGQSQTPVIAETAQLPLLWRVRAQTLSVGIFLAIVAAVAASIYLQRIRYGRISSCVGRNPIACEYAGVNVCKQYWIALLLGGALAGLGGAVDVCGTHGLLQTRFTAGYGFDGIAVAFLARGVPWGCVPAALALATLRTAGQSMQFELDISKDIVSILEAMLIAALAIQLTWSKRSNHVQSLPLGATK